MCLTGRQDVEVFHYEEMEAVVGKDVFLPCILKDGTDLKIVNIEWSKNKNEKLAVYNPHFGLNAVWPNVTIQLENNLGSYLHLPRVSKWDGGIYICDLTTFPLGAIRRETELKIKDKGKYMQSHTYSTCVHQTLQSSQDLIFG